MNQSETFSNNKNIFPERTSFLLENKSAEIAIELVGFGSITRKIIGLGAIALILGLLTGWAKDYMDEPSTKPLEVAPAPATTESGKILQDKIKRDES